MEVLKLYIKYVSLKRISLLQHFKIYNSVFKIIRQTFIRKLNTFEEEQAAFAIHATIRNEYDISKSCIISKTGTFNTNQ